MDPTPAAFTSFLNDRADLELEFDIFKHALTLTDEVYHGGTYIDSATSKPRQFDLRVTLRNRERSIWFSIEAKSYKAEKPLLVLGIKRTARESYHDLIYTVDPKRIGRPWGAVAITIPSSNLFPERSFVGKWIQQVKYDGSQITGRESDDTESIYSRWSQAVSSGTAFAHFAAREKPPAADKHLVSYVQPILVVPDGVLWTSEFDFVAKKFSAAVKTDETNMFLGSEVHMGERPLRFSHLRIFTLAKLKSYLGGLTVNMLTWDQFIFPETTMTEKFITRDKWP
jgi:hypothetical protein